MQELTLEVTDRAYAGLLRAAEKNNISVTQLISEFIQHQGISYANLFGIGVLTSAGFVARFTPKEYGDILQAATENQDVANLIKQLTSTGFVFLDDPRLIPGLHLLASLGLILPERIPAILEYGIIVQE